MKPKINLTEEVDLIDDCNWGEWACEYSLDGGRTWHEGNVQSDGEAIAYESLRDEAGNTVEWSDELPTDLKFHIPDEL